MICTKSITYSLSAVDVQHCITSLTTERNIWYLCSFGIERRKSIEKIP